MRSACPQPAARAHSSIVATTAVDRVKSVAAGVALLRKRDAARAAFLATVLAAEAEADREGCVAGEKMLARIRARLADKRSLSV